MSLEWHDDLKLGIPELDDQHRTMFRDFATFCRACNSGKGHKVMLGLIGSLERHALAHFTTEERLMAEYGYPGLHEQKLQHAGFQKDIKDFASWVRGGVGTNELCLSIEGKLIRWLMQHILDVDRQMVDFIMAKKAEAHGDSPASS